MHENSLITSKQRDILQTEFYKERKRHYQNLMTEVRSKISDIILDLYRKKFGPEKFKSLQKVSLAIGYAAGSYVFQQFLITSQGDPFPRIMNEYDLEVVFKDELTVEIKENLLSLLIRKTHIDEEEKQISINQFELPEEIKTIGDLKRYDFHLFTLLKNALNLNNEKKIARNLRAKLKFETLKQNIYYGSKKI